MRRSNLQGAQLAVACGPVRDTVPHPGHLNLNPGNLFVMYGCLCTSSSACKVGSAVVRAWIQFNLGACSRAIEIRSRGLLQVPDQLLPTNYSQAADGLLSHARWSLAQLPERALPPDFDNALAKAVRLSMRPIILFAARVTQVVVIIVAPTGSLSPCYACVCQACGHGIW